MKTAADPWADAMAAAALLAVDDALGGAIVRTPPGPARDAWLVALRDLMPEAAPSRRIPSHIDDDRLLGGLDLAATLAANRPIASRGLLSEADGGVALLSMAERCTPSLASRLGAVLDLGEVRVERDGFAALHGARFILVALDEGAEPEECAPAALAERLAFHIDLSALRPGPSRLTRTDIEAAKRALRLMLVLLAAGGLLASCATRPPAPATTAAPIAIERDLAGRNTAHGAFRSITGARRSFTAELNGAWDGRVLTLVEDFVFDDGERDRKTWRLERLANGEWRGTREDVVGAARGFQDGAVFRLEYDVNLVTGNGRTRKVRFRDVLALQVDGDVVNTATVGWYGLRVGSVSLLMTRPSGS